MATGISRHRAPRHRASTLVAALGLAAALALAPAPPARAMKEGLTAQGFRYASGGVSDAERVTLRANRDRYSLWVVTAARTSGDFLSDVNLTIVDAAEQIVFDGPLDGPWLFIDLPLGRYELIANAGGQARRQFTTVHAGDHHEAVFYFDVEANGAPLR